MPFFLAVAFPLPVVIKTLLRYEIKDVVICLCKLCHPFFRQ